MRPTPDFRLYVPQTLHAAVFLSLSLLFISSGSGHEWRILLKFSGCINLSGIKRFYALWTFILFSLYKGIILSSKSGRVLFEYSCFSMLFILCQLVH